MANATDGTIGPNLDVTSTSAKFALGTRVTGANGQVWVYVRASEAISAYNVVTITKAFAAAKSTVALLTAGKIVGFAQIAFATDEYGWVPINGTSISTLLDGTTDILPGQALALSTTAGLLAVYSSTAQIKIAGVMSLTTASGTSVTTEIIASNPSAVLVAGS